MLLFSSMNTATTLQNPRTIEYSREKRPGSDFLFRLFLILLGFLLLCLIVLLKSYTATDFRKDPIILLYTVLVTTFELSRIMSAMLFPSIRRKIAAAKVVRDNYEPTASFVIPCKNEGEAIAKTIDKCYAADYPREKLEVIVINDGSTDNTAEVLERMKIKYPDLTVVHWKVNRGKRHGMAEGFKLSKGEIIVQLDSDSYIDPKTFRKLIEPFANPEIGAVCAHADPENADKNILTKMQAAYYFMSFRVLKAAESTFMSVFCCSGCSSAYRREIVVPILDTWLKERFLGLPVTWGDDRALTNWVLRQGYKTIYTDEAKALTICPDTWKIFFKQQTRWKKGWFVNSVNAAKFIFKREPFVALTYFYPLIAITLITPFMAVRAFVYNPIYRDVTPLFYVIGVYLIACIMVIFYRLIARENKYWPYMFVWSTINMVFLSFILFYALATIQNRKWGTR
ncbi:glycosyltransferase [Candidatus Parcubacteria bacterium]|nr:glycosyltransferase [Candidatus Parcubacteria bacterium]